MKTEIKQRIEQIKNRQVPHGYKKTKIGIVPSEWEENRLKNYFSKLSRKNTENNTNVLTISAYYGLINQNEFFNKEVASVDKSNYYLLKKGEFAYNKSYSNGYPYGAIKKLKFYENGVVSPLYICFCANEINKCPEYFEYYFESGRLNKEIKAFAQEGARNHGLLNISVSDFFNSSIVIPSLPEQWKIVKILSTQDKVIELKERLLEEKKKQKKYLMQNLLTGKIKLKGFTCGWKKVNLSEITSLRGGYAFKSEYFIEKGVPVIKISNILDNGIIGGNFSYYQEQLNDIQFLLPNNAILLAMSGATTGKVAILRNFENKKIYQNQRVGYFKDLAKVNYNFLSFVIKSQLFSLKIKNIIASGAQPNISSKDIDRFVFYIPKDKDEQKEIAKILLTADKEIELLQKQLEQEKQKKKALMQLLLTGIVRV